MNIIYTGRIITMQNVIKKSPTLVYLFKLVYHMSTKMYATVHGSAH